MNDIITNSSTGVLFIINSLICETDCHLTGKKLEPLKIMLGKNRCERI